MITHTEINARLLMERLTSDEAEMVEALDEIFDEEIERQFKNGDVVYVNKAVVMQKLKDHDHPVKRQAIILNALFSRCKSAGWVVQTDYEGRYFEVTPKDKKK